MKDKNCDSDFHVGSKWFEQIPEDCRRCDRVTDQVLIELKEEAKKILDSEIANYNIKNSKTNPDYKWIKTVMLKGTVSDKIAAYTILIQDNPVYNLETIKNVIGMVKVGKKKECVAIIETLSELFLSNLLRPGEKLRSFHERPLAMLSELASGNAITRRKLLSYWYFEDQLREAYHMFVQALNAAAQDTVISNKEKATAAMSELLAGNPEQEKNLLSHLVNKLGDPSQKVASKTMYCLTQVLKLHSNMQCVMLKEIEKLLFRANVGQKAQYYSLCFLSQFYLCAGNPNVARKLIEVYFSFFKKCIKEGNVDSRMMSVLLIGVKRAYPYAQLKFASISEHIGTMYRIVHIANFNVSLNALSLLFQVSQCADSVNDRFYSALYQKLLDPRLPRCTNQALLLNLVYKAMTRDDKSVRVAAFVKRLLQIALNLAPNFACGVLFLISQLLPKEASVNMLELRANVARAEELEDDDEKYVDVRDDDPIANSKSEDDGTKVVGMKAIGWLHRHANKSARTTKPYDPSARNPLAANASLSAYFELMELKNHYHPSVRLFAESILEGRRITYTGDPLKDFTFIRFLERFVFKNPKKGGGDMPAGSTFSRRKNYRPRGIRAIAVLSNDYLSQSENNIPADEIFLYAYMQTRYKDANIEDDSQERDSDAESVASEEFEEMIAKMSGLQNADVDNIDFMNEVGKTMKHRQTEQPGEDQLDTDPDESDISDVEEGDATFEMDDDDRELVGDLSGEDDEEEVFISGDDAPDIARAGMVDNRKSTNESVFASAEEFASILEDAGHSKVAPGSSGQFSNADKAAGRQLDWEEKRHRWLNGYNSAMGKNRKPFKPKNGRKRSNRFICQQMTKKVKKQAR